MAALRPRLAAQHAFTLVELLIVMVVIAALLLVAVPSYLGFAGQAKERTAASDVRAAVPSAEGYHADNATYAGLNMTALQLYDGNVDIDQIRVSDDGRSYCLDKTFRGVSAFVVRGAAPHTPAAPGASAGDIDETGVCPTVVDNIAN